MTTTRNRHVCTRTAAALALACLCLAPPPARAGARPQKALTPRAMPAPKLTTLPKLLVVKSGPGSTAAAPNLEPNLPQPLKLTAAFKQALLLQAGQPAAQTAAPVLISPAKARIPGFARLHLCNPKTVSGGSSTCPEGFASFHSQSGFPSITLNDRSASIAITAPSAGKRYLIDFRVTGGTTYALRCGTGLKQTFSGTEHLVVLFEAVSTYPCLLTISGVTALSNQVWYFRGCEITPLN